MRAAIGATAFALHPVAVYGAAYLVQRSIVLATLFSLLSLIFLLRGLQSDRYRDTLWAALLYSLAVLSKEHAVLLPAVALPLAALAGASRRNSLRHTGLYLAACAPAAIFIALLSTGVIGRPYEPQFDQIAAQAARAAAVQATSAAAQAAGTAEKTAMPGAPAAIPAAPPKPAPLGAIQLLSGGNAGKQLELAKPLTTLGKPGVQVAVLTRRPQGYFITHVEGDKRPEVNGQQIGAAPHALKDHDVIELAGIKMEFFLKT